MTLPAVPFWFLRHGETDYNARGLSQGAADVKLNETGRAQALAAGRFLQGRGIAGIVASPMRRARETAALANETLGLAVSYDDDLREAVFGVKEGQPLHPWYASWVAGEFVVEGAETFAELAHRAGAALTRALQSPGPVLVVSHGGVFRALRGLMAGSAGQGGIGNGVPVLCRPGRDGWLVRRGG